MEHLNNQPVPFRDQGQKQVDFSNLSEYNYFDLYFGRWLKNKCFPNILLIQKQAVSFIF
jgi:hypothetical protein